MAEQKQQSAEARVHQIPVQSRKPVEIYRILPSRHGNGVNGDWTMIPGLQRNIRVSEGSVDLVITTHCHGHPADAAKRVDLGIFINGQKMGIDGHKAAGWDAGGNGMALSHTPTWSSMMSIASVSLPRADNDYVVDVRGRGNGSLNGVALLIQVFRPQPSMDWFPVPLDDGETFFNTNLEYRVQIKGKTFAYATMVQKEKLWFFYADDNGNTPGMKHVVYSDKRCFDDKYCITAIQCCQRRVHRQ